MALAESSATPLRRWRYGIHPASAGATVHSLGRVDLPLGESIRLEMVSPEPGSEDAVHVQYYICTEFGGWAVWVSCARRDLADLDAMVASLTPPDMGSS